MPGMLIFRLCTSLPSLLFLSVNAAVMGSHASVLLFSVNELAGMVISLSMLPLHVVWLRMSNK